ncbi:MAG: LytR C-terminal domain-containing protein [Sphingomonadaceae bacterium]
MSTVVAAPPEVAVAPPAAAEPAPLRIEISNGNGIAGMAARTARLLEGPQLKVVRLSNVRPFVVPLSRIEYHQPQQQAARALSERLGGMQLVAQPDDRRSDVRIILGRDLRRVAPSVTAAQPAGSSAGFP